jgi:hypothetical protein
MKTDNLDAVASSSKLDDIWGTEIPEYARNELYVLKSTAAAARGLAKDTEQALAFLRNHDDIEKCKAADCGCCAAGLPELVENLVDDHRRVKGELKRLMAAVDDADYDVAQSAGGVIYLVNKGTVMA